jgi:integrase
MAMPRIVTTMTAKAVEALREPGMHAVGGVPGLFLKIVPPNSKYWVLRATMPDGRRGQHGLGPYPRVPLADAREAATDVLRSIRKGADPIEAKRAARQEAQREREASAAKQVTFKDAAERYIEYRASRWRNDRSATAWESSIRMWAYPSIGHLAVADVERAHIRALLEPMWTNDESGRLVTAMRLRGRIEKILDYAMMSGWRPEGPNPAVWKGKLEHVLTDPAELRKLKPVEHHPRVPEAELYGFMAEVRATFGIGARCLEFLTLTGVRSGEVRGARWSEIDLNKAMWSIPGERMKIGKPHMVPLSTQAVALLKALPRFVDSDVVFPSPRANRELCDATLLEIMRRMVAKGTITQGVPHGLRGSLRTWAGDNGFAPEVAEAALAHTVGNNSVERAYLGTTYYDRRKPLMQAWADFLDMPLPEEGSNVVDIQARKAS